MPQLALAAVGSAIGSFAISGTVLGMSGAALGWSLGSVLGSVFFAPEAPKAQLQDTRAAKVQFGARMPRPAGRVRLPLNPRWVSDWRAEERETGGKGGGGGAEYFVYYADGLFWVADATQAVKLIAMTKLWNNGKLVWSASDDGTPEDIQNSADQPLFSEVRFWDGNAAQMPWPVYEAAVGTANADAHRRIACVSIENYAGGTTPQWGLLEGEFITVGTQAPGDVFWLLNFDDGNGVTTASDQSSWAHSVTVSNMAQSTALTAFGLTGMANTAVNASFGVSSSVSVPWVASTQGLTLEGRVRLASAAIGNGAWIFGGIDTDGGDPIQVSVVDDVSPDLKRITLQVFDQTISTTSVAPPEYPVTAGSWLAWSIDWDPDTQTATFRINGSTVLALTYSGTLPTTIQITGAFADGPSILHSAGDMAIDALRFTRRIRRYQADYTPPTSAPTDDLGGQWTAGVVDLEDLADSEMARCRPGVTGWYDNSELAGIEVSGIVLASSAAESMQQLAASHFFNATCRDRIITRLRGSAVVVIIPNRDTGVATDRGDEPFAGVEIPDGLEVPRKWLVSSPSRASDYDAETEESDRVLSNSAEVREVQMLEVLTAAQRKGLANALAIDAFVGAHVASITHSNKYAMLESCDVVVVEDDEGNTHRMRIERQQHGDDVFTEDLVLDDLAAVPEDGITTEAYTPASTVAGTGTVDGVLIDGPIARDADDDHGLYWATDLDGGATAASLFQSTDDVTFSEVAQNTRDAITGVATTVLGDWTRGYLRDDLNTVRVTVSGTLTSATQAAILADETVNAFALGVHGRWEYGQFMDATLVSSAGGRYTYDLRRFLRGRRGSEHAMGSHAVDDTFVLLRLSGLRRVSADSGEVGLPRYWKSVPAGRQPSSVPSVLLTNTAEGRKPYSGVRPAVARDLSNNATITWLRRTRRTCRLVGTAGISCPLGEASEAYEVDIYADDTFTTVVRTITGLTNESASYSAAQQTTDGLTPGDPISARVYQLSETVGRGHALEFTL